MPRSSNFSTAWFGSATPPAGTLISTYGGSGVGMVGGLGNGGDSVNLFLPSGHRITGVDGAFLAADGIETDRLDESSRLTRRRLC
jgi:hypothetical protein